MERQIVSGPGLCRSRSGPTCRVCARWRIRFVSGQLGFDPETGDAGPSGRVACELEKDARDASGRVSAASPARGRRDKSTA
jgi:hypothetical protein